MTTVFISHSSKDRRFVADEIVPLLEEHGLSPWYSTAHIKTAAEWAKQITDALERSEWFLVVVSRNSAKSEWVKAEVDWAQEHRKGRIVPVRLDDCHPSEVHLPLRLIQYADFAGDREAAKKKLLKVWGIATARRSPTPTPPTTTRGQIQSEKPKANPKKSAPPPARYYTPKRSAYIALIATFPVTFPLFAVYCYVAWVVWLLFGGWISLGRHKEALFPFSKDSFREDAEGIRSVAALVLWPLWFPILVTIYAGNRDVGFVGGIVWVPVAWAIGYYFSEDEMAENIGEGASPLAAPLRRGFAFKEPLDLPPG